MQLDSYFGGVVVVFLSTLVFVAGLLITRKLVDLNKLRASHEVGGYPLSVVGTLYAVLLGLVFVDAMEKFQVARDVTQSEWQNQRTQTNMAFAGIPTDEWVTLFAGAIITIFFTYFLDLKIFHCKLS